MTVPTKLNEGKTKIIWSDPTFPARVIIQSKNDITAGDGAKHDLMTDKAKLANETTCNVFEFLQRHGIKTHFLGRSSQKPNSFIADELRMIPIECVARRVATGSYIQRNPQVAEGTRFDQVVIEFFYKDNDLHDPLMVHDYPSRRIFLFGPNNRLRRATLIIFHTMSRMTSAPRTLSGWLSLRELSFFFWKRRGLRKM